MLYFVHLNRGIVIQEWNDYMENNPDFEALTNEQSKFYSAHPTASISEVRNCQLNAQVVVELTLQEAKAAAISEIDACSVETISKFVSDLQLANAQITIYLQNNNITTDTVYTLENAAATIARYNNIGKQCRDAYYAYVASISSCETNAAVADIIAAAKLFFNNINL